MNYVIKGIVIKGDGYGRKLGFPTVNLDPVAREQRGGDNLKAGVYAGEAVLNGKKYRAGIVIGPAAKIEAHLIGYAGDAYGQEVALELQKFIREYKKFDTEEELINQIEKDIKICSQA
ncbi:MAG: riboflavin kinase [Patescibacteria group bacterium]